MNLLRTGSRYFFVRSSIALLFPRPMVSMASSSSAAAATPAPRFRTWPITATRALEPDLRAMGLRVPASSIDGTTGESAGPCLSDALVSVGPAGRGGTGSFVSESGLILTNWHVAYDAVRQASLADGTRDYVEEGFVAGGREEEIRGPNYEVWITEKCDDVSSRVLQMLGTEADPLKRANLVRDIVQELAQEAQKEAVGNDSGGGEGIRCEVQEMLPYESFVMFTYRRLRDVRIVYVPPKSLGGFGGDTDNFEWPRHTADFTLLRAYVAPDGSAAEYSPDNVPYKSEARLQVKKEGAAENDMVFLLGFPGSTMRYAPTSRLRYADDLAVPHMVLDFTRKLQLIAEHEVDSAEAALKLGNSKKGLANELKRSKGKLVMMRKLGLLKEREAEEALLSQKAPRAGEALGRLSEIYEELRKTSAVSSALESCRGIYAGSSLMAAGHSLHEFLEVEGLKPDAKRESAYRERNLPFLSKRLAKRLGDVHIPHEAALVVDALKTLAETPQAEELHRRVVEIIGADTGDAVGRSALLPLDADSLAALLAAGGDAATVREDSFVRCAAVLWESYESDRDRTRALFSERDALFAELLELHRSTGSEVVYPDCNGSLRISAGYVEGSCPADAVTHAPHTTLAGLFEKAVEARLAGGGGSENEFACPDRLYEILAAGDGTAAKVPVCLLYSTDTVGGNSGSPVMDADGKFVAINFDRQRQGLMNEFKWSPDYSRSIGVDVRYILWLVGEYDGAKHLVEEMLE